MGNGRLAHHLVGECLRGKLLSWRHGRDEPGPLHNQRTMEPGQKLDVRKCDLRPSDRFAIKGVFDQDLDTPVFWLSLALNHDEAVTFLR